MDKIKFKDYSQYPPELKQAWEYRDRYIILPDSIFDTVSKKDGMVNSLMDLAEWEMRYTDMGDEK